MYPYIKPYPIHYIFSFLFRFFDLFLFIIFCSRFVLMKHTFCGSDIRSGTWDGVTSQANLEVHFFFVFFNFICLFNIKEPYEYVLHKEVPFGSGSPYMTMWRSYMDTRDAYSAVNAIGIFILFLFHHKSCFLFSFVSFVCFY